MPDEIPRTWILTRRDRAAAQAEVGGSEDIDAIPGVDGEARSEHVHPIDTRWRYWPR